MECSLDESETIAINFQGIELKDLIDDGDRDLYPPLSVSFLKIFHKKTNTVMNILVRKSLFTILKVHCI